MNINQELSEEWYSEKKKKKSNERYLLCGFLYHI